MTADELVTSHDLIESMEARALRKRTLALRIADVFTSGFGGVGFLLLNLIFFAGWIAYNSGLIPGTVVFDPFPFILLTMIVSLEAIVLSIIVLMSQNRQARIDSLRDEMELQVDLIAERELTKVLQLLYNLHQKLNLPLEADPELEQMLKNVDVSYIEQKLEEQLLEDRGVRLHHVLTRPVVELVHTASKAVKTSQERLRELRTKPKEP